MELEANPCPSGEPLPKEICKEIEKFGFPHTTTEIFRSQWFHWETLEI